MALRLSGNADADALLGNDAFALLIGMVLDQQIPLERAFSAPHVLRGRLGGELSAEAIAQLDPEDLRAAFAHKPALHRFPGAMAERVQQLAQVIVEEYGGRAATVWEGAENGAQLLKRLEALPGFGRQKAKIFLALVGKQLGVRPTGWREAAAPFGAEGSFLSVADIDGPESLEKVRAHKRQLKAAAASRGDARTGGAEAPPVPGQ